MLLLESKICRERCLLKESKYFIRSLHALNSYYKRAMFVQPKYAKLLNTAAIRQVMGEPPKGDAPVHLADGENLNALTKEK